jgi:hypothetical protein
MTSLYSKRQEKILLPGIDATLHYHFNKGRDLSGWKVNIRYVAHWIQSRLRKLRLARFAVIRKVACHKAVYVAQTSRMSTV